MTGSFHRLSDLFMHFPGIGARQARRFVYHLLALSPAERAELARLITDLGRDIAQCSACQRYFIRHHKIGSRTSSAPEVRLHDLCDLCSDEDRDTTQLLLIEKDADLENVRKTGAYRGHYFVLGGSIPILEKNPELRIRGALLLARVEALAREGLSETILALSATPQGDHTGEYLRLLLEPLAKKHRIQITALGRGLSTGTELEYSDDETIQEALKHRE